MTIKVNKPKKSSINKEIEETSIVLKKAKKKVQIKNVYLYEGEDFDITTFKEDAAICDIEYIISTKNSKNYEDYSPKQLALISYNAKGISIETYPMLFSLGKRIYTYDIPIKLMNFFRRELEYEIGDGGVPKKTKMPFYERFKSDNGITDTVWEAWKFKAESDEKMGLLLYALDISRNYQKTIILEGGLDGFFSATYATFMTKNLFKEFTDEYQINNKLGVVADNFKGLEDLSEEELRDVMSNSKIFLKQLNKHKEEEEIL